MCPTRTKSPGLGFPNGQWHIRVRALGFHLATPRAQILVAKRGCPQALPRNCVAIRLLGGRGSVFGSRGLVLCCMSLSASEVYHLTVDELRQVCSERGQG